MSKKDKKIRGVRKEIGVLADHQKVGKRFIPPFLKMDKIVEVRWVDPILPELLWLGLLNARYGLAKGAELAVAISRACFSISTKIVMISPAV